MVDRAQPRGAWTEKRFVLCLGRLVFRKGFDLGIEAFEMVADEFPEMELFVVGDGPERESLASRVEESPVRRRITLTGEVNAEEKAWLMAQCELFLMPNRPVEGDMEGFGIVFLEAGWAGKAVIGGNNGGVPEAIEDGVTGYCVESPDVEAISSSLRKLLRSKARCHAMGQSGLRRVEDHFLWIVLGSRFVESIKKAYGADAKKS